MDSRNLFKFRFVDRFQEKKKLTDFLDGKLEFNTLWLSGKQGVGKTRLIHEVVEKRCSNDLMSIICSFEDSSGTDKLEEFIKQLQDKADLSFSDFLKSNYTSLLDISKQITVQILKLIGIDLSGFISAAYDGTKIFVTQKKQQHAAPKVIANYIKAILKGKSLTLIIVLDHFSGCKKESVDLFMQIVGQFIDNSKILFIISTTDEEMASRKYIQTELLSRIPVVPLVIEAFDEDIYFYEILQEIFNIPIDAKPIISQVYTACEGSPVRLQAALMELYRTNVIQLGKDKATVNFSRLRQIIFQEELSFKLEHYKIPAQMLLRLIVGLEERAPLSLLLDAGKYVLQKMFLGMSILADNLSEELGSLYQLNLIDISVDGKNIVKLNNPIIREILREKFSDDPVHRLFSQMLVSYLCENRDYIISTGVTEEWVEKEIVTHSIIGQIADWVQRALKYGLAQYKRNRISDALEVFSAMQSEVNSIPSNKLIKVVDCFFQSGKYEAAEGMLQVIECRGDYNEWQFYYYYSRIQNLLLRKDRALELAKVAADISHNEEEHIKSLNMQQQILVDTTGGQSAAKKIFDNLVSRFRKANIAVQRLILPTLKTAIDFYHNEEAFSFIEMAKNMASTEDNQLEGAYILTNEGFEHFRQGNPVAAENCFKSSAQTLFDIRVHEISYPLNNLANCYMSKSMFEEAITILLRASLWNTSGYAFVTIQTLLMVCYAHIGKHDKSRLIAKNLDSYIELFGITDSTMLRKMYLNMALVYNYLGEHDLSEQYAIKAYPLTLHTSSWYRAYEMVKDIIHEDRNPMDFCLKGEEWYWNSGCYEPWLITFSHD